MTDTLRKMRILQYFFDSHHYRNKESCINKHTVNDDSAEIRFIAVLDTNGNCIVLLTLTYVYGYRRESVPGIGNYSEN